MTDAQLPAGWYQVDDRTDRWWDGRQWTEHLHNRADGPPQGPPQQRNGTGPARTGQGGPVGTAAGAAGPSSGWEVDRAKKDKAPWWRRGWVIGLAALLVGFSLGAASAGTTDPADLPAYQEQAAELDDARSQMEQQAAELEDAQAQAEEAEAEVESIAGDLPDREAALEQAQAELESAQGKVTRDQAALKKAQAAVTKRERAVGIAETTIAKNTIPGDGIFEVGVDMKAGTYKSAGATGSQCYSAVNADANGNNILSNNLTAGPSTVQVSDGQFFETSSCQEWVLQP